MTKTKRSNVTAKIICFVWIITSCYILYLENSLSQRQIILLLRSYSFSCLYLVIIWPVCFFSQIHDKKSYIQTLFYGFLLCFISVLCIYLQNFYLSQYLRIKYAPQYLSLLSIYSALFFAVTSIGYLLNTKGIFSSFILLLASTNILWGNFFIKKWEITRYLVIDCILYSNFLIAISRCYPDYDLLRTGQIYELCTIGANYPFIYPEYYEYLCLYLGIGIICVTSKLFYFENSSKDKFSKKMSP